MRKLYHKLNQVLSSNGLRKVTSSIQILNRARDEILRLEKLDEDFTRKRKELMLMRAQLFRDFSGKLDWLSNPNEKKVAVLNLKEGLKKIKEGSKAPSFGRGHNNPNSWDDNIIISE